MPQTSLKQIKLKFSIILLIVIIALAIISFICIKDLLNSNYQQQQAENLKIKAHSISSRLGFYKSILKNLSKEQATINMAEFALTSEAQTWALKIQRLIPNSVAVALFDSEGSILGTIESFRIGDRCIEDLHKHLNKQSFSQPPVHRDTLHFEHFDLFQSIGDEFDTAGILFASFKLSTLQSLLNQLTEQGQHLQLFTGDGNIIVETNRFSAASHDHKNTLYQLRLPIENTNWYLLANVEKNDFTDILTYLTLTNTMQFILLSLVLSIFSKQLTVRFSADFKLIRTLLIELKNGNYNINDIKYKFIETQSIISEIQHLAEDISNYQSQLLKFSQCDDLTGLLNRRGFMQEAEHCIDLAKRNIESTIILIDLDYFKQINDSFGHATGDKVLQIFSSCLKSSSRSIDISARLGGDEFIIILVKCDADQANIWYAKIAKDFLQQQEKQLNLPTNSQLCTISAGYTSIQNNDITISDLLAHADKALYKSKNSGRSTISEY